MKVVDFVQIELLIVAQCTWKPQCVHILCKLLNVEYHGNKKIIIQIFCANQIIHWCSMRVKTASVAHLVQSINNIVTSFSHNHFINSLLEGERTFFRRVMMCSKQKCSAIKYQGRLIWNVFYVQRLERRSCYNKVKAGKTNFTLKR